jgi:hypothetical protein
MFIIDPPTFQSLHLNPLLAIFKELKHNSSSETFFGKKVKYFPAVNFEKGQMKFSLFILMLGRFC